MRVEGNLSISTDVSIKNTSRELGKMQMQENKNKNEEYENGSFPGEKQLIDAIEKSNKDFRMTDSSLQFSIHEKTKEIMVKVIDNETKEVLKELPPEKILDMVAAMLERTGLFVDKKA